MSDSVELVLFYGPPFIGKTLHYYNHYSNTHTRISASEIFKEDKCSNLRLVILKVIELLSKGKNVVIDDENWYIATRQSYTSLIKKKVPNCAFTIVQFTPDVSSGYEQCLWAREWALVDETLLERKDYNSSLLIDSDEKLDCWFARKRSNLNPPEFPTTAEGFSVVTVKPQLICGTCCKFNLPALFVQWQSILTDAQDKNLNYKPTVPEVFNKWLEKTSSGRIIVIGPKTKNDKDIMELQTKTLLLHLASQLTCPLYFTFIDEKHQLDQYSRLPQPGVLAFLQKFHTVSLYHKRTLYIYSTDEHYRAGNSVGIRTFKTELSDASLCILKPVDINSFLGGISGFDLNKHWDSVTKANPVHDVIKTIIDASKLFSHPHLIDSVYGGETTSSLCFLQNVLQVNCTATSKEKQGEPVREAQIPFFSRAQKSSSPLAWKYCYGKVSGVCFKDKLALERYQTQYKLVARLAQPPGKKKQKTSRTKSVPSTVTQQSKATSLSSEKSLDARSLVRGINLREVAETPGRFNGGFQCKDNVFNINVEVLERRLKITGKCNGTSRQPYDVQVMLSDSSGLLSGNCSCPDTAGKIGRCKHVIGLLLNYKDELAPRTSRTESKKASPAQKSKNDGNDASSSSNKRGAQTLYCMSQEEFLETAKDILKKSEQTEKQQIQESADNNDVNLLANQQDRSTVEESKIGEVLKEVLFSAINESEKSPKKLCPERIPSFAEDTPTDKMPCSHQASDNVPSVIIPDSLVPETISLVPETIRTMSTSSTHSSNEEPEPRERRLSKPSDSFDAFLDEMI